MAEFQIIERNDTGTTTRAAGSTQQFVVPNRLPILPVRNVVVFPGMVLPLEPGKELLDEVMRGEKVLGVLTQKNAETRKVGADDVYSVGSVCVIHKLYANQAIIVGLVRFR